FPGARDHRLVGRGHARGVETHVGTALPIADEISGGAAQAEAPGEPQVEIPVLAALSAVLTSASEVESRFGQRGAAEERGAGVANEVGEQQRGAVSALELRGVARGDQSPLLIDAVPPAVS